MTFLMCPTTVIEKKQPTCFETFDQDFPNGPFNRIASSCYREIAARYRHVAEDNVFVPLFQPLTSDDQDVLICCVETLHSVFVDGTDPSGFLQLLVPHSRRLMELYKYQI